MQGIGDGGTFSTQVSSTAIEAAELFVTQPGYDRGLGGALVIGAAVLAYAALMGCDDRKRMRTALLCLGAGAAAAFASTNLFPWAQIERLTRGLINYLQFPYRLMMFADVFLSLAAGWGVLWLYMEPEPSATTRAFSPWVKSGRAFQVVSAALRSASVTLRCSRG